jgi:hypothetical protein
MADRGKFPKPYVDSVPEEGKDPMMQTVDFDRMGIAARSSAMPKSGSDGPLPIEHVGGSATGGKR